MRYIGETFWPAAILLFSPRWIYALPLLAMLPFALWMNRKALIPLSLSGLLVAGPLMGFNIPFGKPDPSRRGNVVRVLTYNIHEGMFNAEQFAVLLKESAVDMAALQECPEELKLPIPNGWHLVKKRGLALISRHPILSVAPLEVLQPGEQWPGTHLLQAVIRTPGGDVAFCSLHLPSPRFGLHALLDRKTIIRPSRKNLLEQQIAGRDHVNGELKKTVDRLKLPVIIAGDFNTPVESSMYRKYWGGYDNAFSKTAWGYGWTQRISVRGLPFGVRIDHILAGNKAVPLTTVIGSDLGSDHLPLIADIELGSR